MINTSIYIYLQLDKLLVNEGALVVLNLKGELVFARLTVAGLLDSSITQISRLFSPAIVALEYRFPHLRINLAASNHYTFYLDQMVNVLHKILKIHALK